MWLVVYESWLPHKTNLPWLVMQEASALSVLQTLPSGLRYKPTVEKTRCESCRKRGSACPAQWVMKTYYPSACSSGRAWNTMLYNNSSALAMACVILRVGRWTMVYLDDNGRYSDGRWSILLKAKAQQKIHCPPFLSFRELLHSSAYILDLSAGN
jgi:hypothetical protein